MHRTQVGAIVRRIIAPLALTLAALSLWFGHSPPRTAGAYESRAAESARLLSSQALTAASWATAVQRGQSPRLSATVGVDDAEGDARTTASRFASWDPPAGTEDVRRDVIALSEDVTGELADTRIAAHAGRWTEAAARSITLRRLSGQLQQLAARVAP